jgi:hypothetical protein
MTSSRFSFLADLIRSPDAAPRQTQRDREAERAQSRADIAYGRRMFLEQQAQQAAEADPEAQRMAFYKAQALKIIQAGARARGLPVPTRLVQDDQDDAEDHDAPGPGDDSPVDDRKDKGKKAKKKAKPAADDDEPEGAEDETDKNENGETSAQYWRRVKATAAAIVMAGKRRRGEVS